MSTPEEPTDSTDRPAVRRSLFARNPWLLPLVLVLLILAVVLGFTLGPKLKSSSSPTSTPASTPQRVLVVTATPGPGTPTAVSNPAVPPTATPSSGQGASTPLPGATPVPTVLGLKLGMITRPQHVVDTIQAGADKHDPNYTFYLDPIQVVQKTLPSYGFTQGFQLVSPAPSPTPTPYTSVDGRPAVDVVVSYQGRKYKVTLVQPGKRGPTGIWVVATILAA